jgi:hypothetical protein
MHHGVDAKNADLAGLFNLERSTITAEDFLRRQSYDFGLSKIRPNKTFSFRYIMPPHTLLQTPQP